jgi:hypothetical protein
MAIVQLPQTPNVGPETPNDLWKWLIELGNRIRALIDKANTPIGATEPTAHAATHASAGSDPVTPAAIGAAAASHVGAALGTGVHPMPTYSDVGAAAATQQSWQAPTLLNSWVNYGSTLATAEYYKDSIGRVHLKGTVKNGVTTSGTTMFTLPAGYRPNALLIFTTIGGSSHVLSRVDVDSAGNVMFNRGGDNAYLSLDGISFRAEA